MSSKRSRRQVLTRVPAAGLLLALTAAYAGASPAIAAAGTNYYVDSVHGSDDHSGTSHDSPWRSFGHINNQGLKPGDTVNLARGSKWTGAGDGSATLTINGAGHSGSPITIKPYEEGPQPVLGNPSGENSSAVAVRAPWVVVKGLALVDVHRAGVYLDGGADHAIVREIEVSHAGVGVEIQSQDNLITRNNIHDGRLVVDQPGGSWGANGVLVHSPNNEISFNRFTNCRAPSQAYGADGGAVEFFDTADNVSVHHNYAANGDGFIEVGGGSARNAVVAYNVIVNSGQVVGLHLSGQFAASVENFQFQNNTVVDTRDGGAFSLFYVDGALPEAGAFAVRNNIFYANNYANLVQGSADFTHDHNLYHFTGSKPQMNYGLGAREKVADPKLANVGEGDFHLRGGSPARGSGKWTEHSMGCDGKQLPEDSSVDMGAVGGC